MAVMSRGNALVAGVVFIGLLGAVAVALQSPAFQGAVYTYLEGADSRIQVAASAAPKGTDTDECTADHPQGQVDPATKKVKKVGKFCQPSATLSAQAMTAASAAADNHCVADARVPAGKCWVKYCVPGNAKKCTIISGTKQPTAVPTSEADYDAIKGGAEGGASEKDTAAFSDTESLKMEDTASCQVLGTGCSGQGAIEAQKDKVADAKAEADRLAALAQDPDSDLTSRRAAAAAQEKLRLEEENLRELQSQASRLTPGEGTGGSQVETSATDKLNSWECGTGLCFKDTKDGAWKTAFEGTGWTCAPAGNGTTQCTAVTEGTSAPTCTGSNCNNKQDTCTGPNCSRQQTNTFPPGSTSGAGSGSGGLGDIGKILSSLFGGQKQQPAAGNTTPQAAGTCSVQYLCSGNTLYYRQSTCVDQVVQYCTYGCSSGTACATTPGTGTGTGTGGQISCQPQLADIGMTVGISYSCANTAAVASVTGLSASGSSGSLTTTIQNPGTGVNSITYALTCTASGVQSSGGSCTVQVNKPSIVLVANPKEIASGKESNLGWVTVGMKECVISSPTLSEFTEQNKNIKNVSGGVKTPALATTTDFVLSCKTLAEQAKVASTTVTIK